MRAAAYSRILSAITQCGPVSWLIREPIDYPTYGRRSQAGALQHDSRRSFVRIARRGVLDLAFDLQLFEPSIRSEGGIQHQALALDRCKIARGQAVHEQQPLLPVLFRLRIDRINLLRQSGLSDKHFPALA